MSITAVTIANQEYVILPKREFELLTRIPAGSVDAVGYATQSIAKDLREMREAAGLTQVELGRRLRKSQTLISGKPPAGWSVWNMF